MNARSAFDEEGIERSKIGQGDGFQRVHQQRRHATGRKKVDGCAFGNSSTKFEQNVGSIQARLVGKRVHSLENGYFFRFDGAA